MHISAFVQHVIADECIIEVIDYVVEISPLENFQRLKLNF